MVTRTHSSSSNNNNKSIRYRKKKKKATTTSSLFDRHHDDQQQRHHHDERYPGWNILHTLMMSSTTTTTTTSVNTTHSEPLLRAGHPLQTGDQDTHHLPTDDCSNDENNSKVLQLTGVIKNKKILEEEPTKISFAKQGIILPSSPSLEEEEEPTTTSTTTKTLSSSQQLIRNLVKYGPQRLMKQQLSKQMNDDDATEEEEKEATTSTDNNNNPLKFEVGVDVDNDDNATNSECSYVCTLAGTPSIYEVENDEYIRLFTNIFHSTVQSMANYGYSTNLTRYDLFHGHLFVTTSTTKTPSSSSSSSSALTTTKKSDTTPNTGQQQQQRDNAAGIPEDDDIDVDDVVVDAGDVAGMLLHCYEYPNTTTTTATTSLDSVGTDEVNETLTTTNATITTSRTHQGEQQQQQQEEEEEKEEGREEQHDGDCCNCILPGVNLGYCQINSNCTPTLEEWRYRNVLWCSWCDNDNDDRSSISGGGASSSRIARTDAHYQQSSKECIWLLDGNSSQVSNLRVRVVGDNNTTTTATTEQDQFGYNCPNTVWEGYFGHVIGDVYYVNNVLYYCPH